jgi:hypothetical protein
VESETTQMGSVKIKNSNQREVKMWYNYYRNFGNGCTNLDDLLPDDNTGAYSESELEYWENVERNQKKADILGVVLLIGIPVFIITLPPILNYFFPFLLAR